MVLNMSVLMDVLALPLILLVLKLLMIIMMPLIIMENVCVGWLELKLIVIENNWLSEESWQLLVRFKYAKVGALK